ncbi:hypothetical protein HYH03_008364 [Edaphochlamys debaryana]|uniref:Peptidase S8/S53 domain-containing protein n=1 Tax=Edaphochlamys debaryana TaxID=47281 RepID=A0A835Y6W1_9CHLO|nr:hypothetical protein HYH03_008364 [Edaphochlamys debaryana]|eukprot:KAG2493550.1 hypothetical protein HYH03_008364 [Edaphochlamys debaryana]
MPEEGNDANQPLVDADGRPSGADNNANLLRQRLQQLEQSGTRTTYFSDWVRQRRKQVACLAFLLLACVVLVAVVPPVCVLKGCGAGDGSSASDASQPSNRLVLNFQAIETTVRSKVPPLLYQYFEEKALSSGVKVVSFENSQVLEEVRKILQSQPDLLNLIDDVPGYSPPSTGILPPYNSGGSGLRRRAAEAPLGDAMGSKQYALTVVKAKEAWDIAQGVPDVVVAVVDTGCDMNHPDLKDNYWTNPGEIPGNGIDDDGNGFIDDVHGYDFAGDCESDFVAGKCGGQGNPDDKHSHGSHCTGIVAALRNNGVGTIGVAPKVKIMCLKVATPLGTFYAGHILRAYDYALKMGAHVVSCSFGPAAPNLNSLDTAAAERDAQETNLYAAQIQPMADKNMLIVAAAGNENTDLERLVAINHTYNPCFMAKRFSANMLCVMATDEEDKRWFEILNNKALGSNFGISTVDIGAPGANILSTVPSSNWGEKTGSSMATPLVAGVAALVTSVLGQANGSADGASGYYQGREARQIVIESGDRLAIPVRTGRRVNALAAVTAAMGKVQGISALVPQTGFDYTQQAVLALGFNETYYSAALGLEERNDWSDQYTYDKSTRRGVSRFEGYKLGAGYMVVVKASLYLPSTGMYSMQITTSANLSDLAIIVGQNTLDLRTTTRHTLFSKGDWYSFEIRYMNPTAVIDIQMADVSSSQLSYMPNFYIATPDPPRDYSFAPEIALSSGFQVFTRPPPDGVLLTTNILDGPEPPVINTPPPSPPAANFTGTQPPSPPMPPAPPPPAYIVTPMPTRLELNQPYNYSGMVDDVNLTGPTDLRDALYAGLQQPPPVVVGMMHSRLRAPEVPMMFKLSCALCALYINGLRLIDIYPPDGNTTAGTVLTRVSSCVTFSAAYRLHDIILRFGARTDSAPIQLGWLPCSTSPNANPVTVTTHTMNNLLWKPQSGVAAYVPGMQCDVWGYGDHPRTMPPLYKVRLPAALTQTETGTRGQYANSVLYGSLSSSGCSADEVSSPNCKMAAGFTVQDTVSRWPDFSIIGGTPMEELFVRCYTYVNRGFSTGMMQVLGSSSLSVSVYMGSQTVFKADQSVTNVDYFLASLAPNTTVLPTGTHQLLSIEWSGVLGLSWLALLDGLDSSELFMLDMQNALLPIPIVAQRTPTTVRPITGAPPNIPAAPPPSKLRTPPLPSWMTARGRRRALSAAEGLSAAVDGEGAAEEPGEGVEGLGGSRAGAARQLLQTRISKAGFNPVALGASAYVVEQVAKSPGLTATVFNFSTEVFYEKIGYLSTMVLNRIDSDLTLVASQRKSKEAGLSGALGSSSDVQISRRGRPLPRYVIASGFIKTPAKQSSGPMVTYHLRVRDLDAQSIAIVMGNITVRNAVEFPAVNTVETRVPITLPAGLSGYLPTVVTLRTNRTDAAARYDVVFIDPATKAETPVSNAMWYGLQDGA